MNFREWLSEEELQEGFWDTARNVAANVGSGVAGAAGKAWQAYNQWANQYQSMGRRSPSDYYFADLKDKIAQYNKNQELNQQYKSRGFKTNDEINQMTQQGQHGEALIQSLVRQHLQDNPTVDPKHIFQKLDNPATKQLISNLNMASSNPIMADRKQEFTGHLYKVIAQALGIGPAPVMDMSKLHS